MNEFNVSCPINVLLQPESRIPNPGDDTNSTSSTIAAPLTLSLSLRVELDDPFCVQFLAQWPIWPHRRQRERFCRSLTSLLNCLFTALACPNLRDFCSLKISVLRSFQVAASTSAISSSSKLSPAFWFSVKPILGQESLDLLKLNGIRAVCLTCIGHVNILVFLHLLLHNEGRRTLCMLSRCKELWKTAAHGCHHNIKAVTIARWSGERPLALRHIQPRASDGKSTDTFRLHFENASCTRDVQLARLSPSVADNSKTSFKHSASQS